MEHVKTTGNDMDDFDDAELEELYSWIDGIPLSRPKRNIARDFSDGVLVAELVRHCCSQKGLVDLHNYTGANSTNKKEENWRLMNRKVFTKLGFELGDDVMRDVITAKPGVIEKVLMMLRTKLNRAEWELKKQTQKSKGGGGKKESDKPEADQYMVVKGNDPWGWESEFLERDWTRGIKVYGSPRGKGMKQDTTRGPDYPSIPKHKIIRSIAESDAVPRILFEEKEQECLAKDETIRILEAKIHRMEHLIHLKDVRIDDLQNRLETMRPTGVRRM
ncbi:sperm flagellar protein 1-like isoform X4 [Mytilus californianus]|uniref:sperm flagellar protein 1-like isoform X4 n=1 Tax=Mytilus californianus TaxID=6549 RepID=UPI002246EBD3|nr:sperm flagellar protein 1-like isoform X4 [Mytilus californianus]